MFNWFFKKLNPTAPPPKVAEDYYDSDMEPEYITYEEAQQIAQEQAIRDLHESPELITYVHYCEGFDDFCRVNIRFERPGRGTYFICSLPTAERLESELIDDSKIEAVAKAGRRTNAVRLHRAKYDNSLVDAVAAVRAMESKP
jgi:hypothetical protein